MNPIDICYTPLDIPEAPSFNSDALHKWFDKIYNGRLTSTNPLEKPTLAEKTLDKNYPWKKVNVYFSKLGWQHNFNTLFPELATYLFSVYELGQNDIEEITLLPTKEELKGLAFWHADRDPYGLRIYLENDKYEGNPLFYRKTKIPYDTKQTFPVVISDSDPMFEDEMILCKQIKATQGFYLNNIRGIHNIYINEVPAKRIAVVIKTVSTDTKVQEKIKNLIVNSALKYKEYAIIY